MANQDQFDIILQGVGAWNAYRVSSTTPIGLSEAELGKADLSKADLNEVNLSKAYLSEANFRGADPGGTDLTHARLEETILGDTNLIGVRGLDFCDHLRPSTIDLRTLTKSGPLPINFLRG
jgi:hypothetical protein